MAGQVFHSLSKAYNQLVAAGVELVVVLVGFSTGFPKPLNFGAMVLGFFPTMILLFQLFYFLFIILFAKGTCQNSSSPRTSFAEKTKDPLPIETIFKLPSPLPTWPSGGGFASGTIDLGGLEVCQISSFTKIWATKEGGWNDLGATFFEPSQIPDGYFMLGSYAQPNNNALFGWVLAGKDTTGDPSNGTLKQPTDYTLVWSSESSKIAQDGNGYIWLPTAPDGYKAVGHAVTTSPDKPSLDKVRCVRSDFTDPSETDAWIWGKDDGINVFSFRPSTRGVQALGVPTGTFFVALNSGPVTASLPCLKNVKANMSSMPNPSQLQALFQAYSPWIYLHPHEEYFPSSVSWFFTNGALLYKKGDESNPVSIDLMGGNLPQDGSNDGAYWLDLPSDNAAKQMVKRGNLTDAEVYFHVKPMLGMAFTDVTIWVFYPFNGPAKARLGLINFSLGRIGEHVGDWEHLTLRISNFDGELKSVYFSQHSGGVWVSASELEFQGGNKPVTYSALHSHAFSPRAGLALQGRDGIGIRMDTAKSDAVVDTGAVFLMVAAEYLEPPPPVEPSWLNYAREWGPKIDYNTVDETNRVAKMLPGFLRKKFRKFISSLPKEVLGEEGPTGPKMKDDWSGDERT